MVPIKVQKTRPAKCRVLQKVNRAESITGGLSTKKGDFPCSSVRASKRGRISKQGPVGKSSRPAARLQPANEETLVTPSRTSGLCRSRHSSQRSETRVPHGPAAQEQQTSSSTSFLPQCRINPDSQPVHSGLAGKGYHNNPEHPHPGVLEQIVPCTKGRWEKETCPRPISAKFVHKDSRSKNGTPREDIAECVAINVGNNPRYSRRFPSSIDSQNLSEIFLLLFQRPNIHVFLRMPFGLTIAPWAFSRLMRPVKSFLRQWGVVISSFIDDFLNLAITKDQAAQHNFWTRSVLTWLGFRINEKKSQQNPCQILEYLGVLIKCLHTK